jgi:hypothetical protein
VGDARPIDRQDGNGNRNDFAVHIPRLRDAWDEALAISGRRRRRAIVAAVGGRRLKCPQCPKFPGFDRRLMEKNTMFSRALSVSPRSIESTRGENAKDGVSLSDGSESSGEARARNARQRAGSCDRHIGDLEVVSSENLAESRAVIPDDDDESLSFSLDGLDLAAWSLEPEAPPAMPETIVDSSLPAEQLRARLPRQDSIGDLTRELRQSGQTLDPDIAIIADAFDKVQARELTKPPNRVGVMESVEDPQDRDSLRKTAESYIEKVVSDVGAAFSDVVNSGTQAVVVSYDKGGWAAAHCAQYSRLMLGALEGKISSDRMGLVVAESTGRNQLADHELVLLSHEPLPRVAGKYVPEGGAWVLDPWASAETKFVRVPDDKSLREHFRKVLQTQVNSEFSGQFKLRKGA